ncbi:hypothetical protein QMA71_04565 [Pseudomonas otitidis]|uniref:hypothetical protein n=1 Tax=Metapseudomonas otitidis TaxID=319939 RepID=UPI0024AD7950|nr:hypothetical protein [Pseudomonas otitidis]MDI6524794.1 hypothetical protein [Pseudomonas otitidis]
MAFQFRAGDPRGEPAIHIDGGLFVVLHDYYSRSSLVLSAFSLAEQLNRRIKPTPPQENDR